MEKVRILFIADAVVPTGFSRVAHSIAQYLPQNKFDIAWLGVNYYGDPHGYTYRIYPASNKTPGDLYGMTRIEDILRYENPSIIFMLNDAWILDVYLDKIKNFYKDKALPKIVTYIPVDAQDHDTDWYKNFDVVTKLVAYTQFGYDVINKAYPTDKLEIIPHGVDKGVFFRLNGEKKEIKKLLYGDRDSFTDSFIVLNANRNQPRKRLDLTILGFKLFAENKPENVRLYLHCGVRDSHIDILKVINRLGISERLMLTTLSDGVQQQPNEKLNLIYNATDVGINTGVGEGWGLPNMEHASVGKPQVLADHSSLHELYSDCGVLVPALQPTILTQINTLGFEVRPEDVAEGLDKLYYNQELYNELSEKSFNKFSSEEYHWRNVTKLWDKLFTSIL